MYKEFNIDIQYAAKCIQANKHNHVSASYYLLMKEKIKKGEVSIADVRQPDYNPQLFVNTRVSTTGVAPSKRRNRLENTSIQIEEDELQVESAFKLVPKENVRTSQVRTKTTQPQRLRKIADGLIEFERYADRKKRLQSISKKQQDETMVNNMN